MKIVSYDVEGNESGRVEYDLSDAPDPVLVINSARDNSIVRVKDTDVVTIRISHVGLPSFVPSPGVEPVVEGEDGGVAVSSEGPKSFDEEAEAEAPAQENAPTDPEVTNPDQGGIQLNV